MTVAIDGSPRRRDVIERWCSGSGSTVLVAEADGEVVGLAVLLRRSPSGFAGAVSREVIEQPCRARRFCERFGFAASIDRLVLAA